MPSFVEHASLVLESARERDSRVMFCIYRSTNSNVVVYSSNRTNSNSDDGAIVLPYWLMYEKSGCPMESLTLLERKSAYGVSEERISSSRFMISIQALSDRKLLLVVDENGNACVFTGIGGQEGCELLCIYVHSKSRFGIPKVVYVEILGRHPESGELVYERLMC